MGILAYEGYPEEVYTSGILTCREYGMYVAQSILNGLNGVISPVQSPVPIPAF